MTADWYRKKTWSAADEEDFEAHLKRSRGTYKKSQYLRIQAYHLQHARPPLYVEALRLLERVLNEQRDGSQVSSALLQKAECLYVTLGFDKALPVFREAIAFEKSHRGTQTSVWTGFPWCIVKEKRVDLYDEALDALSFATGTFPLDQFRISVVQAIVRNQKDDIELARSFAKDAFKSAACTHSGFRYHKNVGLVDQMEPWVTCELERILTT